MLGCPPNLTRWKRTGEDRTGGEDRSCTDVVSRHHRGVPADDRIVSNVDRLPFSTVVGGWKLVVENDRCGPDEHAITQSAIVGDVGAALDFTAFSQHHSLADMSQCTDGTPLPNDCVASDVAGPPCDGVVQLSALAR